jgi:ABC-type uncharacterized transport system permease subunit
MAIASDSGGVKWLRIGGLALALVWAGWWTFFGIASGIGEKMSPAGVFAHATLPGLIFCGSVAIAWWKESIGGIVLLLEGVVALIAYPLMTYHNFPLSTIAFVILTMALPPLLAGLLLIVDGRKSSPTTLQNSA